MRFLKKLLLTLLLLPIILAIVLYIVLQTSFSARWLSLWVSDTTDYELSVGKIDHSLSSPLSLNLADVSLAKDNHPPALVVKKASLTFAFPHWNSLLRLRALNLQEGSLDINLENQRTHTDILPATIEQLRLQDIALNITDKQRRITGTGVSAGISPWAPLDSNILGDTSQFQLSAKTFNIDDLAAQNVLIKGAVKQGNLNLDTFGADIAQGQLTGKAEQRPDGSWVIDNLRLSHIRWQTAQSLDSFWEQFSQFPNLSVQNFDLIDAKLEGPDWSFNELDLSLKNTQFQRGKWLAHDGSLNLNAVTLITKNISLNDPIVKLELSDNELKIKQLTTRWEGGMLRVNGSWLRDRQELKLDEVAIAALEYTLPADWRSYWQESLPEWLTTLSIGKLTANRNLIIDTNPDFPFQMTQLDSYGKNLVLVKNRRLGVWNGELTLNASDATFNKIDVRRPSIKMSADGTQLTVSDLSALTNPGLIEAKATLSLLNNQPFTLSMTGQSTPFSVMKAWGWDAALLNGNGGMTLNLKGEVAAAAPITQTVEGTLHMSIDGIQKNQTMHNGVVDAEAPSEMPQPVQPDVPPTAPMEKPPARSPDIPDFL